MLRNKADGASSFRRGRNFASKMPANRNSVNKVIIVGHPTSGLAEVESSLLRYGMKPASPSRREALLPREMTGMLIEAYGASSSRSDTSQSAFQQIAPAPIWNDMALDLEIGNVEQQWWGWADSDMIFLLDYWQTLDPRALFLLVYKQPEDSGGSQQLLDEWGAYNSRMLEFFLRNSEQSLLVNSAAISSNPNELIQQLQTRFGLPPDWQREDGLADCDLDNLFIEDRQLIEAPGLDSVESSRPETLEIPAELLETLHAAVGEYGGNSRGLEFPIWIYQELQSAADLPAAEINETISGGHSDWSALIAQPHLLARHFCELHRELWEFHRRSVKNEAEKTLRQIQGHQTQEELETYFTENNRLRAELRKLRKSLSHHHGAAKRVKKQLSYRLGSILVTHSKSVGGVLSTPYTLFAEASRFRRKKKKDRQKKIDQKKDKRKDAVPMNCGKSFADAEAAKAVDKIKQQLSYRLGQAIVRNSRSPLGWIRLPFSLVRETFRLKKSRPRLNGRSGTSQDKKPNKSKSEH
jgi:regulator of replication initiation timing